MAAPSIRRRAEMLPAAHLVSLGPPANGEYRLTAASNIPYAPVETGNLLLHNKTHPSPPTRGNGIPRSGWFTLSLSSPPTRGNPDRAAVSEPARPFIPAYTGEPYHGHASTCCLAFHPRLHGGTAMRTRFARLGSLSSPPTRGNPSHDNPSFCQTLSSPPTRGNPRPRRRIRVSPPFIPAYTGEPLEQACALFGSAFHPRLHGGTMRPLPRPLRLSLSSPPTRGNPYF